MINRLERGGSRSLKLMNSLHRGAPSKYNGAKCNLKFLAATFQKVKKEQEKFDNII